MDGAAFAVFGRVVELLATFGFGAEDLQAATQVGLAARDAQGHGDNIIILNFRALQAQRIKEIQAKLLELSSERISLEREPDHADKVNELERLNNNVDFWLDRYGLSTTFLFQLHR